MSLQLVIGNKNYSSWSLRPWIAMTVAGLPFEEIVVPLGGPEFKATVGRHSGTGKVPVLIDGDVPVWESLAILEYLADKFPEAHLWPADRVARAHARTIATEMHAGFAALRKALPMNFSRPPMRRPLGDDVRRDIARIEAIWRDCRKRFGERSAAGGPFLFGRFGAADAMYAPVVSRFHTYAVEVGPEAKAYMAAMMALPAWVSWTTAALREPWVHPNAEPDWPDVPRIEVE
ncbi:MAG: glutathione S-transferase family protein [Rhodoplanes sp.]|uniref:glutathione S-transferase family protein n=1 Tax=Rhodoplanes sp. TaxID=1968906 RepID=UPI001854FD67|nr:glutathione S-transferase family protein [Rhodoplanes sp.]NVO13926.1 glutathione S-transferase family protein [Rhodoplanes sp.]